MKKTQSKIVQNDQNIIQHGESIQNLADQFYKSRESNKNNILQLQEINTKRQKYIERQPHTAGINLNKKISMNYEKGSQTWTQLQKRSKMPASLKISLRRKAQQSIHFKQKRKQEIQKKTKLGELLSSKFKKQQFSCGICLGVTKLQDLVYLCKCSHVYCKNCIRDFVTYKIKMYEEVTCPEEQCNFLMNQQTDFYKNLPEQIQKQYGKIHQFYTTSNDPSLRLCPKQECQGVIKIIEGEPRICNKCERQFCPKCYFQKHQGNCEQHQIDFLQNNLHFRQCSNCKFVVERTEGCNHMTCRCKYQFCYVCGKKWTGYEHQCNQNQQAAPVFEENGCLNCCTCCQQTCGQSCTSIIKFPFRLILSLLLLIAVSLVFFNTLLMLSFFFLVSIIAGIFGFSCEFICNLCDQDKGYLAIIFIILFPLAMLVGIFKALTQMFPQMAGRQLQQVWQMLSTGCISIWS